MTNRLYFTTIFGLLFLQQIAIADNVTIPNTFQAGSPARAADVNDNFSAVELSVDDNAQDISTVSTNVFANSQNIGSVTRAVAAFGTESSYRFVGFSTATVNGAAGFFGMNAACQVDFGPEARMASSEEVAKSAIQPTLNAQGAWVRPIIVAVIPIGTSGVMSWEYGGYTTTSPIRTCDSWSSNTGVGFEVRTNGGILPASCSSTQPVSCSAPQ